MRAVAALGMALSALTLSGCPTDDEVPCGLLPYYENASGTLLSMDRCTGRLALGTADAPEAYLPASPAGHPPLAWAVDDIETRMVQGRFVFEGVFDTWHRFAGEGTFPAIGTWAGGDDDVPATVFVGPGPGDSIVLQLTTTADVDRLSFAFGCNESERWYGTGARPQGTDHTASTQVLYTAEQGIGQRDYPLDEIDLLEGRIGDSYFPVPWALNDQGIGVAYGGTPVGRMHFCDPFAERDTLRIEVWDNTMTLLLFPSGSPRAAVSAWTLASGTPAEAPDWAYGPWMAVQRGTDQLLAAADQLRDLEIPASALWSQDWIGGRADALGGYDLHYHWEWDEEQYPDLPDAITTLHADGFAFLGYFNPFITDDFREWDEAHELGYLPTDPDGAPYEFSIVDRYGSVVDLYNPGAYAWAREYLAAAPAMGQDGWMCDFAEWLPLDSTVGDGLSGQRLHNDYPLLWQELNMEVLNQAWGEGEALCFNRSGWTGTQTIAPVTWGGDQETTFARDDGMPTAREIGVGLGLSGVGRYGSDIAGFSSVAGGPSTKEVYLRWVEMSAFEPVMRTHDGLSEDLNWHWSSDEETTDHFRFYAQQHMRLMPYLRILDEAYLSEGLPFMRHTILVEEGSGDAWELLRDAPDQHFLGDDLLIAPVLTEGADSRDVVLPAGRWYPYLAGGAALDSGAEPTQVTVDAPLGSIPVFARAGSILPLGRADRQTSYPAALDNDIVDLVVFTGANGSVTLDGQTWSQESGTDAGGGAPSLNGTPLEPCADPDDAPCVVLDDSAARVLEVRLEWGFEPATLTGSGWSLSTENGSGRTSSVTVRY